MQDGRDASRVTNGQRASAEQMLKALEGDKEVIINNRGGTTNMRFDGTTFRCSGGMGFGIWMGAAGKVVVRSAHLAPSVILREATVMLGGKGHSLWMLLLAVAERRAGLRVLWNEQQ
jgi:hypothetical protein